MFTHASHAKSDSLWRSISGLGRFVAVMVVTLFLGSPSYGVEIVRESQGDWELEQWRQDRVETAHLLKQLFVPEHGVLAVDASSVSVGFPRYAQGGCHPCHGPQCKAPVAPKAPDLSVPLRIENQKRIQLAHQQCANSTMPRGSWSLSMMESTAVRGHLDVLDRPPRLS